MRPLLGVLHLLGVRRSVGALVGGDLRPSRNVDSSRVRPKRRQVAALQGVEASCGKLIPKVLRHHQASHTAVHDADANATEFGSHNVGAMSRRVHQARVCYLH